MTRAAATKVNSREMGVDLPKLGITSGRFRSSTVWLLPFVATTHVGSAERMIRTVVINEDVGTLGSKLALDAQQSLSRGLHRAQLADTR